MMILFLSEYNFIGNSKIIMKKGKLDRTKLWIDSTAISKSTYAGWTFNFILHKNEF